MPVFSNRGAAALAVVGFMFSAASAGADPEAGRLDYEARCAACHGEAGLGDGPIAEYFTAPPPNLARLAADYDGVFPREEVVAVIDGRQWREAHGGRAMPIWGEVFEHEAREALEGESGDAAWDAADRINDLVDYIETLQQ